jgi:hypothetical protein
MDWKEKRTEMTASREILPGRQDHLKSWTSLGLVSVGPDGLHR